MRDGDHAILNQVQALGGPYAISALTYVELEGGVYSQPARAAERRVRLDRLLASMPTLAFDENAAVVYGQILSSTGYSRRKVIDRMIAAQAIVHSATLVTLNPGDFSDVPNLRLLAL